MARGTRRKKKGGCLGAKGTGASVPVPVIPCRHVASLLALLLFVAQTAPAAASAGAAPKAQNLGEIVVTADRYGEAAGVAIDPTATTVVTETYESARSPQTVQDILESLAEIDVQRGDQTLSDGKDVVKIRGLGARRIMVRIDGRPVRNAGGFYDKLVDWNSLTLENVERVEVIRGGHSAVYGETIGGTINIVTQKGGSRPDGRPEGKATVDISEYDTQKYMAGVSGDMNALSYAFGGAYRQSDGYLKNSGYRLKDVNGRISYRFPFRGRLTFGYKGSFQDKSPYVVNDPADVLTGACYDSGYPVVKAVSAGSTPNYAGAGSYEKRDTEYFDLFFEQPTPVGDWKLHLYKSEEFRDESHHNYSQATGFYDYTEQVDFSDWGWIVHDRFTLFDRHDITVGLEGREYELGYDAVMPTMQWHVPSTRMIAHKAAFLEDVWQVTEKLSLALGLRYDRVDMDVDVNIAGYDDFSKEMDAWCPKSRLNYVFWPGTTGYLNVSKAFRIPTGMEFSYMGVPTGLFIDPETAMEYEGGVIRKLTKDITARLGYYYYDIDNYIMFNRDPYPLLYSGRIEEMVFNADHMVVQGVEAELRFSLFQRLDGYLNYTYQDSELGPTRIAEDQLYDDHYQLPRHKATLGLDYAVLDDTILLAGIRYVDKRKTSLNQEIDDFATVDLAVEQRFLSQQARVKVYVTNLFDTEYEEQYLVPSPDRVFGLNVSFTY